jgi:four helix bundle protein
MGTIRSFRELLVWQRAMDLAERCYRLSRRFPREDQWSLGQQIRRSVISVPANIAEGYGRHSTPEYIHHLRFSKGSSNELQTQLDLARRVGIVTPEEAAALVADAEEVGRMLHGLIESLQRSR